MSADPSAPAGPSTEELTARFRAAKSFPQGSITLGFEFVSLDRDAMRVEATFLARPEFANPMGVVQGGFLTGMLDETMSIAGGVASGMTHFMPTLEMKTSFLRSVRADGARIHVIGRVVKWGRTIAFTEGELRDATGALCATATATALPTPVDRFKPSPKAEP